MGFLNYDVETRRAVPPAGGGGRRWFALSVAMKKSPLVARSESPLVAS